MKIAIICLLLSGCSGLVTEQDWARLRNSNSETVDLRSEKEKAVDAYNSRQNTFKQRSLDCEIDQNTLKCREDGPLLSR